MSILLSRNTKLLVQGITGAEGSNHARLCKAYGTNVVAGVTPGRAGQEVDGIPVFNYVGEAVENLVVCITDGLPTIDMVSVRRYLRGSKTVLIGPNCPGCIAPPEAAKAGIMPASSFTPGRIGLVSRSGTLLYEAGAQLSAAGLGQSSAVGIGGDPVPGTSFIDIFRRYNEDPETDAIVMIGEIGGTGEQEAAEYVKENVKKPVFAFIAGASARPGRRMGHAGAIISGADATAEGKLKAIERAGGTAIRNPAEIGKVVASTLKK